MTPATVRFSFLFLFRVRLCEPASDAPRVARDVIYCIILFFFFHYYYWRCSPWSARECCAHEPTATTAAKRTSAHKARWKQNGKYTYIYICIWTAIENIILLIYKSKQTLGENVYGSDLFVLARVFMLYRNNIYSYNIHCSVRQDTISFFRPPQVKVNNQKDKKLKQKQKLNSIGVA